MRYLERMTTTTTTVRLDDEAREALAQLTADGTSQNQAIRNAILLAAREVEREELRRWAHEVSNDATDRAEMDKVQAEMDEIRAW